MTERDARKWRTGVVAVALTGVYALLSTGGLLYNLFTMPAFDFAGSAAWVAMCAVLLAASGLAAARLWNHRRAPDRAERALHAGAVLAAITAATLIADWIVQTIRVFG
jgi:hypothetical protein